MSEVEIVNWNSALKILHSSTLWPWNVVNDACTWLPEGDYREDGVRCVGPLESVETTFYRSQVEGWACLVYVRQLGKPMEKTTCYDMEVDLRLLNTFRAAHNSVRIVHKP
jgi:hypothetical protein